MKNFRITENDKKYITDLYKSKNIFLEQTVATGSDASSTTSSTASTTPYDYNMKELQELIKQKGGDLGRFGADGKYGNYTAKAILTLLEKPAKEQPKPEETQPSPPQPAPDRAPIIQPTQIANPTAPTAQIQTPQQPAA
jgi:hypothetical protein